MLCEIFSIEANGWEVGSWIKRRHTSTNDAERSGRPKDITTPEIFEKIHNIVLDDLKVKVRELTEAVSISIGSVGKTLHEDLGMRKLTDRVGTDETAPYFDTRCKKNSKNFFTVN